MILTDNMRGAVLMTGAMCAYTVNDAFMKLALAEIPFFQAVMLRGVGAVICLAVMCHSLGQLRVRLSRGDWQLVALRTAAEIGGTYFLLTALIHMPIANVSAILQVLPLTVSLAAAVFLREHLGWRRLTAICTGFIGVLMIIQPGGADFSLYSVYALLAVACVTLRDLAVRRMQATVPSVFVALIAAIGVTAMGALGSLFITTVPVTLAAGLDLAGATVFLIAGYLCSVMAMRWGDIGFVAPFRYTSLLVALVLGALVFDSWPDGLMLAGAAIVVVTGLFTLYREARLRRKTPPLPLRIR